MSHGHGGGRIRNGRLAQGPRQRVGYPKGLGGIPSHPPATYTSHHLFTRSLAIIFSLTSISLSLSIHRHLPDRAVAAGDCPAESMEWWQKAVVVPVKRAWIVAAARLRRKKDGKIIIFFIVLLIHICFLCMNAINLSLLSHLLP